MQLNLGPVYFDYHATTPVLPEVEQAMMPFWQKTLAIPPVVTPTASAPSSP